MQNFQEHPFFTEQLQWLLLRFNSCLTRSPKQKPVWLSAINIKVSWNSTVFGAVKIQKQPPWVFCKRRPVERDSSILKFLSTPNLKNICERLLLKISTSMTNLSKGDHFWFFYPFKPFGIVNFSMTEWFFSSNMFCQSLSVIVFFSQIWYFYHKKVVTWKL